MNNMRNNNQDNINIKLKKRLRANDSMNKYKKKNQNLIKNQNIERNTENEDLPLRNSKPLLTEISSQYENTLKKYERPDLSRFIKKDSFYSSKFNLSRAYTPRRNFQRKNIFINSNLNRHLNRGDTFYRHSKRITDLYDNDRFNTNRNVIRNYSRPNFLESSNELNSTEMNSSYIRRRYNYNRDNIKAKETATLNKILEKQVDALKIKAQEKNYKIKELMKFNEKLSLDNQNLKTKNQKLIMNLNQMKNQLENSKNFSYNELETKIKHKKKKKQKKEKSMN